MAFRAESFRLTIRSDDADTNAVAGDMSKVSVTEMDVTCNRSISDDSVDGAVVYVNDEALEKLLSSTNREVLGWAATSGKRKSARSRSTKPNTKAHITDDGTRTRGIITMKGKNLYLNVSYTQNPRIRPSKAVTDNSNEYHASSFWW